MINLVKIQPGPDCLAKEKEKANGSYYCGDVLERLVDEFHNKCYICEHKLLTNYNIEHFKPHKENKDLKFDWNNLFLACSHCNNIKSDKYDNILNCTDPNHNIIESIKFEINPSYPKEKTKITPLNDNIIVHNTVDLLNSIYNGTTKLKILQAANLRQELVKEVSKFGKLLYEYFQDGLDIYEKDMYLRKIKRELKSSSPFTAFKIWIVLENQTYMSEFQDYLEVI